MVKPGTYIYTVTFLHDDQTHHTLQGNGGEDDGMLDPPITLSVSYTAFPTSSITNRRYAYPLHCAFMELIILWI